MSTCLMVVNINQNVINSKVDYKVDRTKAQKMNNPVKENAPLISMQEEETTIFDPDLALRICIAMFVPLTWCLE